MRKFLSGCVLGLSPLFSYAQSTSTPAAYWQQEAKYSIDVVLDDQQHLLTGKEELQYTNNSPDQLTFIWFHLWPNAYRDNTTALAKQLRRNGDLKFEFAKPEQRGFIDQLDFKVNGQPTSLEFDPTNPDVAKLLLPQPLAPGASITITTPFRVKLPESFSRMSHLGQSYQVTQWYPKPAVYDRKGWHQMPYLQNGEFYSDFGSFDVRITLPANYVVGATGVLQNADEQARLDQLAAATALKKTSKDFGKDESFPASSPETKTLRFVQDKVHDFAWFADKRFNVLKSGVTLPSGRQVTSWVMFLNKDAQRWIKALDNVNSALLNYSKWVGEYPYASATAVDGALSAGAGMEYPMVTVTQVSADAVVHEVGHNWFYGILATNEREHPWMDESVNTYFHHRVLALDTAGGIYTKIMRSPVLKKAASFAGVDQQTIQAGSYIPYQAMATRGLYQAPSQPSAALTNNNYGVALYMTAPAQLKYLASYLGQDKFDAAMQAYYQRWQFRHPYPEDMQAVFEESAGQKLSWFFQDMLNNTRTYNASVSDVQATDTVKVLVRNDSPAPFAVPVASLDAQGRVLETQWTPVLGVTDEDDETQLNFRRENVAAVVIDPTYLTPELNRRDDRMKTQGSFRRVESIRFQPLLGVQRWDRAAINFIPVVGANTSDKLMLGAAFYSNPAVLQRLSYVAMPMYSFNQKELNGIGMLNVNVLPDRYARQIVTGVLLQRFERYRKVEPSITFLLPAADFDAPQHRVKFASASIYLQDEQHTSSIQTIEYGVKGGNARQHWNADVEYNKLTRDRELEDRNANLLRASATVEQFYAPKKRIQVRLFGGRFLSNISAQASDSLLAERDVPQPYVLGLSGSPDYRYQTAFLDRQQISPALAAQRHQTDDRDGAFKAYMPATSTKWLASLNVLADLPVTSLKAFVDLGAMQNKVTVAEGRKAQRLFYDAGLVVPFFGNRLQFYLPVAGSQFENGLPGSRKDFTDNIRFVFHLESLNPFRILDEQLAK